MVIVNAATKPKIFLIISSLVRLRESLLVTPEPALGFSSALSDVLPTAAFRNVSSLSAHASRRWRASDTDPSEPRRSQSQAQTRPATPTKLSIACVRLKSFRVSPIVALQDDVEYLIAR